MRTVTVAGVVMATALLPIVASQAQKAAPTAASTATAQAPVMTSATDVGLVDTNPLTLIATGNTTVHGTVFLTNQADADRTIALTCVLRSASGEQVPIVATNVGSNPLSPSKEPVPVTFGLTLSKRAPDDFPLTGYITFTFTDAAGTKGGPKGSMKPLAITVKSGKGGGAEWPLLRHAFMAAAIAIAFVAIFITVTEGRGVLIDRMGKPLWSFTESWSSTVTIGAAVMTSLVGFAGLPEQGHTLSKSTYGVMSLITVGLIGLAPGVYNLFRKPVETEAVGGVPAPVQYQGLVVMFLVAALFTVTGALAQLGLLKFLVADLAVAGIVAQPTATALEVLWWGLQGVSLLYAVLSLLQTVKAQTTQGADEAAAKLFLRGRGAAARSTALPDWTLL